jgi:hypothetical protein
MSFCCKLWIPFHRATKRRPGALASNPSNEDNRYDEDEPTPSNHDNTTSGVNPSDASNMPVYDAPGAGAGGGSKIDYSSYVGSTPRTNTPAYGTPTPGGYRLRSRSTSADANVLSSKCQRPSPQGGTCTNLPEQGSAFCTGHRCPQFGCNASKGNETAGCPLHVHVDRVWFD